MITCEEASKPSLHTAASAWAARSSLPSACRWTSLSESGRPRLTSLAPRRQRDLRLLQRQGPVQRVRPRRCSAAPTLACSPRRWRGRRRQPCAARPLRSPRSRARRAAGRQDGRLQAGCRAPGRRGSHPCRAWRHSRRGRAVRGPRAPPAARQACRRAGPPPTHRRGCSPSAARRQRLAVRSSSRRAASAAARSFTVAPLARTAHPAAASSHFRQWPLAARATTHPAQARRAAHRSCQRAPRRPRACTRPAPAL